MMEQNALLMSFTNLHSNADQVLMDGLTSGTYDGSTRAGTKVQHTHHRERNGTSCCLGLTDIDDMIDVTQSYLACHAQ